MRPQDPPDGLYNEVVPFVNNKGHVIRLSRSTTLRELIKMGVVAIHLTKPGAPLLDGEYRDASTPVKPESEITMRSAAVNAVREAARYREGRS